MNIPSAYSLLSSLREGKPLSSSDQFLLIALLSWPAILAQVSVTLMQLIDAGMAGRLGAKAAASIGLVSSTTWLINGICSGAVFGFSVPCAHAIGAKSSKAASICRQGLYCILIISLLIGLGGFAASFYIPNLLGAEEAISADATAYLAVFCLSLPFVLLNSWAVQMLQAAGNTKLPGLAQIVMCLLDVLFNYLFIFVFGLGVAGAALGTAAAEVCSSLFLSFHVLYQQPFLKGPLLVKSDSGTLKQAFKIGLPVSIEQLITGSSYVMFTRIVSSLGSLAIAANSFAITAESLCYMPAYGIASAASGMIGQCIGAGREKLASQIGWRICRTGIIMMSLCGLIMFAAALALMRMLSPDEEIIRLGARVLRLEAFAEPMYGASIVVTGILRGKRDTFWPAVLNLLSIWCVRIPAAWILSSYYGLFGAWMAMNLELNIRGVLFLIRLKKSSSVRSLKNTL